MVGNSDAALGSVIVSEYDLPNYLPPEACPADVVALSLFLCLTGILLLAAVCKINILEKRIRMITRDKGYYDEDDV